MPSADRPPSSAALASPAGAAPSAHRLWLVRHAQPLVAAGLCYGRLDVAADPAHTRDTAARLAAALPPHAVLRTSPRRRCRDLADALAALRPDLRPATVDARLAEMDFGTWEGRRWEAIDPAELDAWTADFARYRPGGGESVAEFMARVAEAFDAVVPAADRVWIAHAGVARAAMLLDRGLRQIAQAADWPRAGPDFGNWIRLPRANDDGACDVSEAPPAGPATRP